MSDSDSFINEVSEEVRRDALYGYLRRYGWIAVLAILALVGGAAWNEYSKSQAQAEAEATGDALIAALSADDPDARVAALTQVEADGAAIAVTALLTAAAQQENGAMDDAAATLGALAVNPDVPEIYRDLSAFKAAMLETNEDPATRRTNLEALAQPGATFALLAQEQLALMDVSEGKTEEAIAKLQAIAEDAAVTRGLLERSRTLLVALGVELAPDAGAAETEEQASE
ncbi:hypothetical protein [Cognatiyoonia koreensis]|uniref:hypothetical protein n=1 Tax=Cognatiyoonia koreensis TaxID=364200 RepID=UPI000B7F05C1|nr:hypothetical protein [Cognatiyoonia koreensis]